MDYSNKITRLNTLDSICRRCHLRKPCSINTLSASVRKKFSDATIHGERWNRGQHLFLPGDRLHYIYIVHSGSFKTYVMSAKGDIQITGFYFQGSVMDFNYSNDVIQNIGAIALETSTICKIPLARFEELVSGSPALSLAFLKIMSREIIIKHRHISVLSKMTARQKVAQFLLHMSAESKAQGSSSVVFKLSMIRSDIANYLGITSETMCRIFKIFHSNGIISVRRHQITINDTKALGLILPYDDTNIKTTAKSQEKGR